MWIKSSVCGPCKKESPKLSIIIMELSGTNDHCTCYLLVSTGFFLQTRIQSCRSQRIWALPSSTPSRCMLPWPILSSSTCVCWTSTLNLPCLATLASSAQLVRIINKNPVFKNIHMTFWSSHLALWFSVKSHHPPVSMQDLPPDLWTWPRKWSRLGWTLQEWTSPMEHMRWVRKHSAIMTNHFRPRSGDIKRLSNWEKKPCCDLTGFSLRKSATCTQAEQHSRIFLTHYKWLSVDLPFTAAAVSVTLLLWPGNCLWL